MAILWSFSAIIGAFILGEAFRFIVKRCLSRKSPYYHYIGEMISAFEFSAAVFEIVVIAKFYSTILGFVCSFCLLCLKNTEYILDGLSANPCGLLEGVVRRNARKTWMVDFVTKICSQLTGALFSFPFMQLVWQSTTSELHFKHLNQGLSSSLEVSLFVGFMVEVTTTFILTMTDFLTRGGLRMFNPYVRAAACILICYVLTGTTGVWMNPVFATVHAFMFTDAKEDIMEHLYIFWVGPVIGTLLAISVDSKVRPPKRKPTSIARTIRKKLHKQTSMMNGIANGIQSVNGTVSNGVIQRTNGLKPKHTTKTKTKKRS